MSAKLPVLSKTSQFALRGIIISLGLCIIISFNHIRNVLIRCTMHMIHGSSRITLLIGSEKLKDLRVEFYDIRALMDS